MVLLRVFILGVLLLSSTVCVDKTVDLFRGIDGSPCAKTEKIASHQTVGSTFASGGAARSAPGQGLTPCDECFPVAGP